MAVIESALIQADKEGRLRTAYTELAAGLETFLHATPRLEDVQADYVALFELNRERPPVHLLQHLHERRTQTTQVELYRRLAERYRSCGITLKQGEGAVPPDQLSVQLEFLAYLCGYLAHAPGEVDAVAVRRATLTDTAQMLHWIDGPIELLAHAGRPHSLYLPLLRFVRCVLDLCDTTVADVD